MATILSFALKSKEFLSAIFDSIKYFIINTGITGSASCNVRVNTIDQNEQFRLLKNPESLPVSNESLENDIRIGTQSRTLEHETLSRIGEKREREKIKK
jgi:hypothetical protein